jgi:hypothetical protein|tara:strand:- start:64 stop:279 length:216 start_codon:yes stop_codon:yes gene_type:complete
VHGKKSVHNLKKGATMKIDFTKDKETKNTVRFSGVSEDGTVNGSLYITKGSDLEKETLISLEVEKAELQEA